MTLKASSGGLRPWSSYGNTGLAGATSRCRASQTRLYRYARSERRTSAPMAHTTPSCCADHLAARPHRRTRSSTSFAGSSSRRSPSARIGVLVERYLSHEQSPSAMPANPLGQIALDGRESGLGLKAPWLRPNLLPVGKAQDKRGPVGQFTGHCVSHINDTVPQGPPLVEEPVGTALADDRCAGLEEGELQAAPAVLPAVRTGGLVDVDPQEPSTWPSPEFGEDAGVAPDDLEDRGDPFVDRTEAVLVLIVEECVERPAHAKLQTVARCRSTSWPMDTLPEVYPPANANTGNVDLDDPSGVGHRPG